MIWKPSSAPRLPHMARSTLHLSIAFALLSVPGCEWWTFLDEYGHHRHHRDAGSGNDGGRPMRARATMVADLTRARATMVADLTRAVTQGLSPIQGPAMLSTISTMSVRRAVRS